MNTATATRRSVAAGTLCRRCRRRDPEPGHPHCLTCAGALAKIEVVRQPTPEPEKRPLATRKRVELAVAWTLLALVGWGFIKIAPFLWLMTKALAVLLPVCFLALAGPRRTSYQAYRYRQYRRRVYGDISRTQGHFQIEFREYTRVGRHAVAESTRFSNRTSLSSAGWPCPRVGSAGTELCRSPRSLPGHDLRLDWHWTDCPGVNP